MKHAARHIAMSSDHGTHRLSPGAPSLMWLSCTKTLGMLHINQAYVFVERAHRLVDEGAV